MRNASLQLAQDKLEKIRGLDYDLIDAGRTCTNNTLPQRPVRHDRLVGHGRWRQRDFTVTYQVD